MSSSVLCCKHLVVLNNTVSLKEMIVLIFSTFYYCTSPVLLQLCCCYLIAVYPPSYMEHTAVVGQSYTIPCNTTVDDDVRWFFESFNTLWHVYEFGRVRGKFQVRFSLNTSVRGLDISTVHLNDSGNYTCIDKNGQGDHHIHQLTVYGKLQ